MATDERSALCGVTAEDYLLQAQALLPQGRAWPRDADAVLTQVLAAISESLARSHDEACRILNVESFPCFSEELLADWEGAFGLPDECAYPASGIAERQLLLCAKIADKGGQSRPYFTALAEAMGYAVELTERHPFMCGMSFCGGPDEVGGAELRFYWSVTVTEPRVTWFECGVSELGITPFALIRRAEDLECRLEKLGPGHAYVTVGYQGA